MACLQIIRTIQGISYKLKLVLLQIRFTPTIKQEGSQRRPPMACRPFIRGLMMIACLLFRVQTVNATYEYDYKGQRVSETNANGTIAYLIDYQLPYGQVIAETDVQEIQKRITTYGLERISQNRNGVVHYYHADGQGSTRQLTDENGDITDSWTFDAFGNTIGRTGTTENNYLYTGEFLDGNSGFYNLRARWYNPTIGRFTGVDPMEVIRRVLLVCTGICMRMHVQCR